MLLLCSWIYDCYFLENSKMFSLFLTNENCPPPPLSQNTTTSYYLECNCCTYIIRFTRFQYIHHKISNIHQKISKMHDKISIKHHKISNKISNKHHQIVEYTTDIKDIAHTSQDYRICITRYWAYTCTCT